MGVITVPFGRQSVLPEYLTLNATLSKRGFDVIKLRTAVKEEIDVSARS